MPTTEEEDLRLLYQVTVSDLAYFKTQQWNVAYYALLLEAGIVGVAQLLSEQITILDRSLLALLAIAAATAALYVTQKLQRSISVRDARLDYVRSTMGPAFRRAWSAELKADSRVSNLILLRGGIIVAALLTVWLVVSRIGVA